MGGSSGGKLKREIFRVQADPRFPLVHEKRKIESRAEKGGD